MRASRAFLGTSLTVREQVFGHLYLADKDGGPFDEEDKRMILALAAAAAVAIDHAKPARRRRRA
ncbi:GAF domain-containing protein [Demequina litorisediminis]|uniref:GAF domain-containing protein n=1 Tax=Demequina litorisediminis TaxID=1849022 RepID=UPI003D675BD5